MKEPRQMQDMEQMPDIGALSLTEAAAVLAAEGYQIGRVSVTLPPRERKKALDDMDAMGSAGPEPGSDRAQWRVVRYTLCAEREEGTESVECAEGADGARRRTVDILAALSPQTP